MRQPVQADASSSDERIRARIEGELIEPPALHPPAD
jgi:hypothetical protein